MWLRAIESGLAMQRQSSASFFSLLKSAKSMSGHGGLSLAQAMMAASAPMLIQRAVVEGDAERGIMATGLVVGRLDDLPPCAELLSQIEADARTRIGALSGESIAVKGAA
jgi:NAD(P)H-dependent flavin oxidoreductase YrpB (nitropropane dioxygenase family)